MSAEPGATLDRMTTTGATSAASASFRVGEKGRVVLPVAVARAAGITEGAEVVARSDGTGRLVIETVESIKRRIRGFAPEPSGLDLAEDVRRLRMEDDAVADAAAARRSRPAGSEQESEAVGAALLAHLGL